MSSEFDLIKRFFTRPTHHTLLGTGDDAALIRLSPGMDLAVSTDMLVAGTHFFPDATPYDLGWKSLAVSISDMSAMGAQSRWATLALALPSADETWLSGFTRGFFECAEAFGIDLVGGDTTRGPLNICVQIMGEVPHGSALRRNGAQEGDDIWVSGQLGDAALALAALQGKIPLPNGDCLSALHLPQPRVALGLALRGLAHAAIDVSDGLLADLGHILAHSGKGATLKLEDIPSSSAMREHASSELGLHCLLAGGDDYELCFTAPASRREAIDELSKKLALRLTRIGEIVAHPGLQVLDAHNQPISIGTTGFDHFT